MTLPLDQIQQNMASGLDLTIEDFNKLCTIEEWESQPCQVCQQPIMDYAENKEVCIECSQK